MASLDDIAGTLAQAAARAGADSHDVLVVQSASTSVGVREGELEDLESSGGTDVGLRVFLGQRQAVVSGSDVSTEALNFLAERAVAMAGNAPEDPYCGLAAQELLTDDDPALDLSDPTELDPDTLKARALELESATLAVDGVDQAEGASASHTRSRFRLLTSHGFSGGWESTRHTVGVSAYASRDGAMERDYDYHGQRHLSDLPGLDIVGRTAGERAVRRLGAKRMASGAMPVIFDRRVADGLLGAFLSAISGPAIARGTSYLKDKMGEQIFPESVNIVDDPRRVRGLGSRPFDAEGVAAERLDLIKDGVLQTWLLNTGSARKLGLKTTGRAHRSVGGPPGVAATNAWINAGTTPVAELADGITSGLMIAEMFGPSLNPNTGDYSVGVAGYAIEKGEITHPVSEVTIAGNLLEMFKHVTVADDLIFDGSVVSPSLRVESLMVAGE